MVQNSSSSIILELLKVIQPKAHKNCPNITLFALYSVFENADRENLDLKRPEKGREWKGGCAHAVTDVVLPHKRIFQE